MDNTFIERIYIRNSRNVRDFEIPLSKSERQHLIITGKNGSGKTSLLDELAKFLKNLVHVDQWSRIFAERQVDSIRQRLTTHPTDRSMIESLNLVNEQFEAWGGTEIHFVWPTKIKDKVQSGVFQFIYFNAHRKAQFAIPTGVQKIGLSPRYKAKPEANTYFLQHLVNLKADRSFARDDNDFVAVRKVDEWFERFDKVLKRVIGVGYGALEFSRKDYNFEVIESGKSPYNLSELSDGYSSILNIVSELMMRMEAHEALTYDFEGVVLIDEIETHLHVDLQKQILPFLTELFPKIQFIVTTHSPFVVSSVSNATICDLEKRIVTKDLSGYSYDALVESYFDSSKYSQELLSQLDEYERLVKSTDRTLADEERLLELETYLNQLPKFSSQELLARLQEIQLAALEK